MSTESRREKLLQILRNAKSPVSGTALAEKLAVSRQVIVQDIALLRAEHQEILSTHKGYIIRKNAPCQRVYKVHHPDERVEEELNIFVDFGGKVEDVFVYHKIYDIIRVDMGLKSRRDIRAYMEKLGSGISRPLKDITSGYHYHTITAESEDILDQIQEELQNKGFLAQLRDYEPMDFQKEEK